jgi:hypothetical protein
MGADRCAAWVDPAITQAETTAKIVNLSGHLKPLHPLKGQWNYTIMTDKLSAAMQIANEPLTGEGTERPGASNQCLSCFGIHVLFLGDFEPTRQYAMCGIQIWSSEDVHPIIYFIMLEKGIFHKSNVVNERASAPAF